MSKNLHLAFVAFAVMGASTLSCLADSLEANASFRIDGEMAHISVSISNTSDQQQVVYVGIRGAAMDGGKFAAFDLDGFLQRSLEVQQAGEKFVGAGAASIPPPTFEFAWGSFTAPQAKWEGLTFRNMAPTLLRIEQNETIEYYRLQVPKSWVEGRFIKGVISFPDSHHNTTNNITIKTFTQITEQGGGGQPATRHESE